MGLEVVKGPFHVTPLNQCASNQEEPMDQPEQPTDPCELEFTVDEDGNRAVNISKGGELTWEQQSRVFAYLMGIDEEAALERLWRQLQAQVMRIAEGDPTPCAELSIGTIPEGGTMVPVEIALRDDSGEARQFRARCSELCHWDLIECGPRGWDLVAHSDKGDPNVCFRTPYLPISVVADFLKLVQAKVYSATVGAGNEPPKPQGSAVVVLRDSEDPQPSREGLHCVECGRPLPECSCPRGPSIIVNDPPQPKGVPEVILPGKAEQELRDWFAEYKRKHDEELAPMERIRRSEEIQRMLSGGMTRVEVRDELLRRDEGSNEPTEDD